MNKPRVYITGCGIVSGAGNGVAPFWSALCAGRSLAQQSKRLTSLSAIAGDVAVEVPRSALEGDAVGYFPRFAAQAALEATTSAGLRRPAVERGATFLATATGTIAEVAAGRSQTFWGEFGGAHAFVSKTISMSLMPFTISTGCTAGLDALGLASDLIASRQFDYCVVVASDAPITPIIAAAFQRIGVAARSENGRPVGAIPFHKDRRGFVLAEGAAAVVIESENHVRARGGNPLAEWAGWSTLSSAYHMTSMRVDGSDLLKLIRNTLAAAQISYSEIDLVDAHGTGTIVNDATEARALQALSTSHSTPPWLTAQKAVFGHSLGTSNLMEIVGCILMMRHGTVPYFPNAGDLEDIRGARFPLSTQRASLRYILKMSHGFSGLHTCAILKSL